MSWKRRAEIRHTTERGTAAGLATLVDAVLRADGWVTKLSPPGADGGVDILGGRGSLGLDDPRLCVQVKSQNAPADVTVYRTLQGTMQTFKAEQGLLVCGSGTGMAITANKVHGVRAAVAWSEETARLAREHNDANVLTIGSKFTDEEHAVALTDLFLRTEFAGGRHARRVAKIAQLEQPNE